VRKIDRGITIQPMRFVYRLQALFRPVNAKYAWVAVLAVPTVCVHIHNMRISFPARWNGVVILILLFETL
jgi:hypothetical protein